ncbi:hypothetical protein D3C87_1478590 [compost metagenome]
MNIVEHTGQQVLAVIAEMLAVNGQSAFVGRLVGDGNTEGQLAFVIQLDIVEGNIRDAAAIDEASFIIDADKLEHAVLVKVRRPPVRVEGAAGSAEITGTGPKANFDAVHIKIQI